MSFLPETYSIPKQTEDEKVEYLIAQAEKGKSWAINKLQTDFGLGDNIPSRAEDSGEPPHDKLTFK